MLLVIDVRNTHTVVGLISGVGDHAKVVSHWRIRTESEVTADELALTIDGLIGDDAERLTGAAGLSTVPTVLHEVRVMLEQYWPSVPHVLIEPGVRTGIPLLVDNPKEVGADRIVNCLAAWQKYGTAAIVVDFGSSICVDVVSAKGEFLGGAIAPGVQVSSDAAAARSAALRRIEVPTWFVNGQYDQLRLNERLFASLVPHSELIVVPRTSHLVTAMRPRVFNAVLDLALATLEAAPPAS